jgi:hypothetical protein
MIPHPRALLKNLSAQSDSNEYATRAVSQHRAVFKAVLKNSPKDRPW